MKLLRQTFGAILIAIILVISFTSMNNSTKNTSNIDTQRESIFGAILYAECTDCQLIDHMLNGSVILNRMKADSVSLEQVIFKKNAFEGYDSDRYNAFLKRYEDERLTDYMKLALEGANRVYNNGSVLDSTVLFFCNYPLVVKRKKNKWWDNKLQKVYESKGKHSYFKLKTKEK